VQIKKDWKTILKKAWSIRFIALAGVLSGLEVILPLFSGSVKPGLFAVLSFFAVSAAFIARIVAQKDL
jgi:hypothetical protein